MRAKFWMSIVFLRILLFPHVKCRSRLYATGLQCQLFDEKFCIVDVCKLKAVSRDITEAYIRVKLLQVPVNNITAEIKLERRNKAEKPLMYSKVDACIFLGNKRRNPVAQFFYNILEFRKYTNINHSCPYDHDIIVNGWRFNENNLKILPISSGSFSVTQAYSVLGVLRIKIIGTFQIVN